MNIFKKIISILLGVFLLLIVLAFFQTYRMNKSPYQEQFSKGTAVLAHGVLKGTADFYTGSWQGKTFDSHNQVGINNFGTGSEATKKYPFTTSFGAGLKDTETEVIKIDYRNDQNPFWISPVLDEMVQIAPNEYLGKIHYRLIPGLPFTLGFFKLQKENTEPIRNITVKGKYFAIKLPQNWKVDFNDPKGVRLNELLAESPDFQMSVDTEATNTPFSPISFQSGATINILVEKGNISFKDKITGTILSEEKITIGEINSTLTTFTEPSTQVGELFDARISYKGNGYIFRMAYNPQNFKDAKQFFKDVLASFRFVE
jgi:hypothetical protein